MTRFTKSSSLLAVAGVVAAFTLTACGSSDNSSAGDSPSAGSCTSGQKLAFMGALTGSSAALGQAAVLGVNTAIDEFNAANPDCKVTLETEDTQGDPDQASKVAPTIINDSAVVGLVGPAFSGESLSTGKAFFQAGLPSISESATNVTITQQGWTTWHRVIANDGAQAPADASYMTGTAGATKVFVADDGSDYGKGLADGVRQALGSADVGDDHTAADGQQTDFSATVSKILASKADGVFYGGYYTNAGLLLKQLRQANYKGVFGSGDGADDPAFIKVAGADAAEGAFLTNGGAPAPADFAAKVAQYNNGAVPGPYTAEAYDAAKVFLDGIAAGVNTREAMQKFVTDYDEQGVTKEVKFDSTGEVATQTIYVYVVKGGQITGGTPVQ